MITKSQETGVQLVKCSADDYFIKDGEYQFDRSKLGKAHGRCKWLAENSMKDGVPLIIVDNTNTTAKEMAPYIQMAKTYGYRVLKKVIGELDEESLKLYTQRNTHGVPYDAIKRMADRFQK